MHIFKQQDTIQHRKALKENNKLLLKSENIIIINIYVCKRKVYTQTQMQIVNYILVQRSRIISHLHICYQIIIQL